MSATSDTVRASDIEFLFEALNYAVAPLIINVALYGAAKDAKPNTLAKRVSIIAKRYNLNIASTTKGDAVGGGSAPATPRKAPGAAAGQKRKTPASKNKIKEEASDGEDDQSERGGAKKKQKKGNGVGVSEEDDDQLDGSVGEEKEPEDVA